MDNWDKSNFAILSAKEKEILAQHLSLMLDNQEENKKKLFDHLSASTNVLKEQDEYLDYLVSIFSKPNMTIQDKNWMQKAYNLLLAYQWDTLENLKKLDAIIYSPNYIQIGDVKRARDDVSLEPNNKTIFHKEGVTYVKQEKKVLDEVNTHIAEQGMEVPSSDNFTFSMENLPGDYKIGWNYRFWALLWLILSMWLNGYVSWKQHWWESGEIIVINKNKGGNYLTMTQWLFGRLFYVYNFFPGNGELYGLSANEAIPIRPILK